MSDNLIYARPPTRGMYEIPGEINTTFKAKSIVFRRFTADFDRGAGQFKFAAHPAKEMPKVKNLDEFLCKLNNGKIEVDDGGRFTDPLNIPVDDQCYVVVELDRKIKWRFSKTLPAVTTKYDYGEKNAYLQHIYDKKEGGSDCNRNGSDCHIVCFGVVWRREDKIHKDPTLFNFHVELYDEINDKSVEIIIDPDITNPGGNGIPKPPSGEGTGNPHIG